MNINIKKIEQIVLCSFINDYTLLDENILKVDIEYFSFPSHKEIFKIIKKLYDSKMPIDEQFILKYADNKILTENQLIEVLVILPVTDIDYYLKEIKENSRKNRINQITNNIKKQISDENIESDEIISNIEQSLLNLEDNSVNLYEHDSKELLEQIKIKMDDIHYNKNNIKYNTGIKNLDNILDGIDDGELIIIAARPSMGKTSLISNICIESLDKNHGVLIESLEMDAQKIMRRLLSSKSEENLSDLKNGIIRNKKKFEDAVEFLSTSNLLIHDESFITLYQLQTKIKQALRKNPNIKNILIDHTGKIKLDGKTREDIEIGNITNSLKKIARENKIRIFLLQQLNRTVESRDNKRPILSDLKNSGNIEEDADIVLGLYRESYYKNRDKDNKIEKDIEPAEIIVLKNRDGKLGTAKVWFEKKTSSFRNNKFAYEEDLIEFE